MALRGTLTHWKTRMLAQALGVMPCHALGVLEALWHTTAELAPSGNIGRLPNQAIAMEMFYEGDADALIAALISSRHLEEHPTHRLIVHDWTQHADHNTKRKVDRRGGSMIANDGSPKVMTRHKSIPVPVPEPVPEPEPEPNAKPTRVQAASVVLPEWVDADVWEGYLDVRRKKRAVLTERALMAVLKQLAQFRARGHDPNAVLETSMRSNWTDVYEPKGAGNGTNQVNHVRGQQRVDQAIDELRKAGVEIPDRRAEAGAPEVRSDAWGGDGRDTPGIVLEGSG